MRVSYSSFFLTLFCYAESMLSNSLCDVTTHCVFKKSILLFPWSCQNPNLSWRHILSSPDLIGKSGIMESILTSEYYIPALNGPVSNFFFIFILFYYYYFFDYFHARFAYTHIGFVVLRRIHWLKHILTEITV